MTFSGTNGSRYLTGQEIGRGGEGTVYDVLDAAALVLKVYNDPLTLVQAAKLRQMKTMTTSAIAAYAAWPEDLALNDAGEVCGFVMKKLIGFVPLHMIFSPMDRKKMFPDKGYNFLAHVARNLAVAFHQLHEAGLVVGDVNEGNILISAAGMVNFIDCDSFQVKGPEGYFFCEVGVPRYTPPELLNLGTFNNAVRTPNTDSFSLAVLIFQLLFLGRHPFAGRNRFKIDIDEESAIKQHEFAYSLQNPARKLLPPKDSFDISNLPEPLVGLFHRAFEHEQRPTAADWVKALDVLMAQMVTCPASRLHTYPGQLKECPWCQFRKTRGILYFLDDSHLDARAQLADIEHFVNGFRLEQLEIRKWDHTPKHAPLTPTPIERTFKVRKNINRTVFMGIIGLLGVLIWAATFDLRAGISLIYIVVFFVLWRKRKKGYIYSAGKFSDELIKRKEAHRRAITELGKAISQYDYSPDVTTYSRGLVTLEQLVQQFRNLPETYFQLKKEVEEQLYDEQLHFYLNHFPIASYVIPLIGPAKKTALADGGILTAADITQLKATKVAGMGPKNIQVLLDWQRQMAAGFVYIPDDRKLAAGLEQVDGEIERRKLQLESQIRKTYQSLSLLRSNISNRAHILAQQINDLTIKSNQAELDLQAFEQFCRKL